MSLWDLHGEEFYAEASLTNSVYYTHAGDDVRELSVKPVLYTIEEIFQPARPSVPGLVREHKFNSMYWRMTALSNLTLMSCSIFCHLPSKSTYLHHE
ncbi:hypothetical protein Patl1_33421 [Pistacia atlantica]|uniref:Uncharacterized protein n=1 Tax=Pistacia atlantica TaxID=434234 RepID=A0ACC0ZSZ0_9ROSI|nr:hypothetical protein Patl1_33421 [Pistacia atlantica]